MRTATGAACGASGAATTPDVAATLADGLRDHASAHEEAEHPAAEAEAEGRLEGGRVGQKRQDHLGRTPLAEAVGEDDRGVEKTAPTPCANRLGGPATGWSAKGS